MTENQIHLLIFTAAAGVIAWLSFLSGHLWREYNREIRKSLAHQTGAGDGILTPEDIRHLPKPVQNYLIYVGAVGREKVRNVEVKADGEMDMHIGSHWTPVKVQQHNFFGSQLIRLFYMKGEGLRASDICAALLYGQAGQHESQARRSVQSGRCERAGNADQ